MSIQNPVVGVCSGRHLKFAHQAAGGGNSDTGCPKKNSPLACCYSGANGLFFLGHPVCVQCIIHLTLTIDM